MSDTLTRLVPTLAHRLFPVVGPGGLLNALLARVVSADTSRLVHVTKHLDVMEVLEREEDFAVRIQGERMVETTGAFILGTTDPAAYASDMEVIGKAVRRGDAALVRAIAREESRKAIDAVRSRGLGTLDAVRDMAWIVPPRVACRYYGTPDIDPGELRALYAETSKYVFAFWQDEKMRPESVAAARKVVALLEGSVRARRASGRFGDHDVLGRMLELDAQGLRFADGDAGIVRSLAGLQAGSLNAPAGLFLFSLERLLDLEGKAGKAVGELARASAAGDATARAALEDHLHEAERFNAYPPYVYRHVERDAVVARGTPRETRIPKGSVVVAWTSMAAFDPDVFAEPFAFVAGRPRWQYLGFGHAKHRCLGEGIGQLMMLEMTEALFSLPGLRHASGKAGKLRTLSVQEGKYASSFGLEFDR